MKRREFIKTAAAGIGGLTILGARGQGAAPAKKPLRVALIGCGGYGNYAHIPAILGHGTSVKSQDGTHTHNPETDGERLVALVDPDSRQIAKAMKRVDEVAPGTDRSKIRVFADYRKMYDEMGKDLDAVIIATPIHQHALPALMAIRRRIHVYLEKPLAHTIAEVRMLTEEARRYGVATQMGNWGQSTEGPASCASTFRRAPSALYARSTAGATALTDSPPTPRAHPLLRFPKSLTGICGSVAHPIAISMTDCWISSGMPGAISATPPSATWVATSSTTPTWH